jgi:hypothetical protein
MCCKTETYGLNVEVTCSLFYTSLVHFNVVNTYQLNKFYDSYTDYTFFGFEVATKIIIDRHGADDRLRARQRTKLSNQTQKTTSQPVDSDRIKWRGGSNDGCVYSSVARTNRQSKIKRLFFGLSSY